MKCYYFITKRSQNAEEMLNKKKLNPRRGALSYTCPPPSPHGYHDRKAIAGMVSVYRAHN